MPNIKPISDLRNYNEALSDVSAGEPVFLTKNGRGKFAVLDIDDYQKMTSSLQLMAQLDEGERSTQKHGWPDL